MAKRYLGWHGLLVGMAAIFALGASEQGCETGQPVPVDSTVEAPAPAPPGSTLPPSASPTTPSSGSTAPSIGSTTPGSSLPDWTWPTRPQPDAGTPPPPSTTPTAPGAGAPSTGGIPGNVPAPTGTCPTFINGDATFAPAGIAPRTVRLYMSTTAAASLDGPLVFYWHGTGSSPSEAIRGLSQSTIDAITAAGGIVAAPYHDPAAGTFPWFLTTGGSRDDDLRVADEVLGCAARQVGIDASRIHALGMSAGGLQTAQMSLRRSSYVASVVLYSGGLTAYGAPASQDPTNKFAALIFHGGSSDVVVMGFQAASETYWTNLTSKGQFAAICNHGRGHTIPTDATGSVWQFFKDHPFGRVPSPYAGGLPAGFPSYCALAP